jgi:fatty acid desaturase
VDLFRDPRIRAVAWRDLAGLSPLETVRELLLPLPWLALSLAAARAGWHAATAAASFVLFLVGLRVAHDAFHRNLGLPRLATDAVLCALSVLMLGSMHAVKWNHLRHHTHCLADEDLEARSARMRWWRAILWGPCFPVVMHAAALRRGGRETRRWVALELALNAAWVAAVVATPLGRWFGWHAIFMTVGQCLTAFFAVWTVHHDCERDGVFARTLRSRAKSAVAFDMFFHVEHHLFPRVPTRRLPALARRLDAAAPEVSAKRVY